MTQPVFRCRRPKDSRWNLAYKGVVDAPYIYWRVEDGGGGGRAVEGRRLRRARKGSEPRRSAAANRARPRGGLRPTRRASGLRHVLVRQPDVGLLEQEVAVQHLGPAEPQVLLPQPVGVEQVLRRQVWVPEQPHQHPLGRQGGRDHVLVAVPHEDTSTVSPAPSRNEVGVPVRRVPSPTPVGGTDSVSDHRGWYNRRLYTSYDRWRSRSRCKCPPGRSFLVLILPDSGRVVPSVLPWDGPRVSVRQPVVPDSSTWRDRQRHPRTETTSGGPLSVRRNGSPVGCRVTRCVGAGSDPRSPRTDGPDLAGSGGYGPAFNARIGR